MLHVYPHPFCTSNPWQGPFAPRALPRFIATMSPSDSRSSQSAVMGSRTLLTQGLRAKCHSNGSLRFLTILSASAVPSHPGEPGRCRRSLLHGRCQASPYLEGLATLRCVTRPNRVHAFALRLTPLPSEASTAGSLRQPLGRLHGERTTTMVSTFQLTRTVKLCLTHQMTPISPISPIEFKNLWIRRNLRIPVFNHDQDNSGGPIATKKPRPELGHGSA